MKIRIGERHHAQSLRREGLTLTEIQRMVGVSKSTLNRWLKDVELTAEQKQRILDSATTGRERARVRGAWRNREKRRQRIAAAVDRAQREFPALVQDPLFIPGVVLYWAEGGKTWDAAASSSTRQSSSGGCGPGRKNWSDVWGFPCPATSWTE